MRNQLGNVEKVMYFYNLFKLNVQYVITLEEGLYLLGKKELR